MSPGLLQAAYRRLYWLPRDYLALRRAGWPDWVVYFGGTGFGDDLLLTAVLHELRRRHSGRLAVISRLTEIFAHSPDVDVVLDNDWPVLSAQLRRGRPGVHPQYFRGVAPPDIDLAPPGHFIAEMCRQIGLSGEVTLRPRLFLQPAELARGRRTAGALPQVAIQCMSAASVNAAPNKVWPTARYQKLVDQTRHRFAFVQLGSPQDPPLNGALDLRGRTTIRESAAILACSAATVCYVGFLMLHARAVTARRSSSSAVGTTLINPATWPTPISPTHPIVRPAGFGTGAPTPCKGWTASPPKK